MKDSSLWPESAWGIVDGELCKVGQMGAGAHAGPELLSSEDLSTALHRVVCVPVCDAAMWTRAVGGGWRGCFLQPWVHQQQHSVSVSRAHLVGLEVPVAPLDVRCGDMLAGARLKCGSAHSRD